MKDSVGDGIKSNTANWKFDENVVPFFDNHVNKSVPLYEEGHDLAIKIADFFLSDQSIVYEIGCSTGTLIEKLAKRNKDKEISIILGFPHTSASRYRYNFNSIFALSFILNINRLFSNVFSFS